MHRVEQKKEMTKGKLDKLSPKTDLVKRVANPDGLKRIKLPYKTRTDSSNTRARVLNYVTTDTDKPTKKKGKLR